MGNERAVCRGREGAAYESGCLPIPAWPGRESVCQRSGQLQPMRIVGKALVCQCPIRTGKALRLVDCTAALVRTRPSRPSLATTQSRCGI